jgi:putative transcriptional regulator
VNNRLRILRAEAGLSQGDLARLLGVSRQTVNAVETDKYDPSLPLALRMAKIFGVAVDEIFLDDWIAPERD